MPLLPDTTRRNFPQHAFFIFACWEDKRLGGFRDPAAASCWQCGCLFIDFVFFGGAWPVCMEIGTDSIRNDIHATLNGLFNVVTHVRMPSKWCVRQIAPIHPRVWAGVPGTGAQCRLACHDFTSGSHFHLSCAPSRCGAFPSIPDWRRLKLIVLEIGRSRWMPHLVTHLNWEHALPSFSIRRIWQPTPVTFDRLVS